MNDIAATLSNQEALKKSGAEHLFMQASPYGALEISSPQSVTA